VSQLKILRIGESIQPGSLVHLPFSSGINNPSSRIAFCLHWP